MQMTFQYSLHILHKDGTLEHKEFLADENSDPRAELAEQMLKDITSLGSIMAYNQGFETARIRELADFIPDKQDKLLALNKRFIDLINPFRSFAYYHPDFNGSLSIKSVLPALFPDNNELDYKQLGSVQDGAMAMNTFANLHLIEDEQQRKQIRVDLLAYCHLDTLAMVRILEELMTVCNGNIEA